MEAYSYTVFKTKWGWFGLLAGGKGLIRSCLPMDDNQLVKQYLLYGVQQASLDENRFSDIENAVKTYYEGKRVEFTGVAVDLEGFTPFQKAVLVALRHITYGQCVTYGSLAEIAGFPKGARAIGGCMAKNPLPLIIPCHRVIKQDGSFGYFSAAGGVDTKKRMLDLEQLGK